MSDDQPQVCICRLVAPNSNTSWHYTDCPQHPEYDEYVQRTQRAEKLREQVQEVVVWRDVDGQVWSAEHRELGITGDGDTVPGALRHLAEALDLVLAEEER